MSPTVGAGLAFVPSAGLVEAAFGAARATSFAGVVAGLERRAATLSGQTGERRRTSDAWTPAEDATVTIVPERARQYVADAGLWTDAVAALRVWSEEYLPEVRNNEATRYADVDAAVALRRRIFAALAQSANITAPYWVSATAEHGDVFAAAGVVDVPRGVGGAYPEEIAVSVRMGTYWALKGIFAPAGVPRPGVVVSSSAAGAIQDWAIREVRTLQNLTGGRARPELIQQAQALANRDVEAWSRACADPRRSAVLGEYFARMVERADTANGARPLVTVLLNAEQELTRRWLRRWGDSTGFARLRAKALSRFAEFVPRWPSLGASAAQIRQAATDAMARAAYEHVQGDGKYTYQGVDFGEIVGTLSALLVRAVGAANGDVLAHPLWPYRRMTEREMRAAIAASEGQAEETVQGRSVWPVLLLAGAGLVLATR